MGLSPELSVRYQQERNEYRRVLQGVSRDKVRWHKCVEYVNSRLGMAVGRMFIEDNFNIESKRTVSYNFHIESKRTVSEKFHIESKYTVS